MATAPDLAVAAGPAARLAACIYVLIAGLTILMIHLIFYPFPDITHVINTSGG